MMILSKYPINVQGVRTFQHFKWKDMPGALPTKKPDGSDWYTKEAWAQFPLSSKSHLDVPVQVGKKTVHILASHPTPASFDGAEDRNGKRNHDEIRFWSDYISDNSGSYIYDDKGVKGSLPENSQFVLLGDQNASPVEANAIAEGIKSLLTTRKLTATLYVPVKVVLNIVRKMLSELTILLFGECALIMYYLPNVVLRLSTAVYSGLPKMNHCPN